MKFVDERPYATPEAAARKLLEIANSVEAVQDGRIFIERINWPFLSELKGTPAEYGAGLNFAVAQGWFWKHESGTFVSLHRPARRCSSDAMRSLRRRLWLGQREPRRYALERRYACTCGCAGMPAPVQSERH